MTDQQIDPDRSALVAPDAAISVIPSAPSFASAVRQSQDALRNDVAHDLVGAARDRPAIAFQEIVHAQAAAVPGPGDRRLPFQRVDAFGAQQEFGVALQEGPPDRSEEHTSELQSLMRTSY